MAKKILGTIDFETDPFLHDRVPVPFASCIWFGDDDNQVVWSEKKCAKKTFDAIEKLPACELYAHNGGKFDFWFLLPWAENQEVKIINGRIAKMRIGECVLIDSYLLIAEPLKKYKKKEIEYKKLEKGVREYHKTEIIDYLVSDCKYLHELVTGFHAILGKKLTIGGAAFASIKKHGIKVKKQNAFHDAMFRPFYLGGRSQCFKTGEFFFRKKPGYILDLNSAYPDAMLSGHPHGAKYRTAKKIRKKDGAWFGIVEGVSRGCLPSKQKNGELTFPDDGVSRIYTATGWEILAGLETGTLEISKIHEILVPAEKISFGPFVHHHYDSRQTAKKKNIDMLGDLVHKKTLNSGYGGFAINPAKFFDWAVAEIGIDVAEYSGGDGYEWYNDVMGRALWRRPVSEEEKNSAYRDVATAASITGYVRARLWRAIKTVDTPYYCDTDSIFCDGPGALELSQGKLGAWKIENRFRHLIVAAKKIYSASLVDGEYKTASKGARMDHNDIDELYRAGSFKWQSDAPSFSIARGVHFVERNIKTTARTKKLIHK